MQYMIVSLGVVVLGVIVWRIAKKKKDKAMAYGIQCRDANGNLTLDSTTRLGRLVFSTIAAKDSSGSTTISGLSDKNIVAAASALANGYLSSEQLAHTVSISGDTVSWSPHKTNFIPNGDSLIMVWVMD